MVFLFRPTFGCYLMSPRTDHTTSDESCWLSTDDEDSGLGPDEVGFGLHEKNSRNIQK
jgi:hypothetical protein